MKKGFPILLTSISGIAVYIFDKIWGNKIPWNRLSFFPSFEWMDNNIKISSILLVLIVGLIVILALRFLYIHFFNSKHETTNESSDIEKQIVVLKSAQIRNFNKLLYNGIFWKWEVNFGTGGRPFIRDLVPYCPNHGGHPPLKMQYDSMLKYFNCVKLGCSNKISANWMYGDDYEKAKLYIESILEHKWEESVRG